MLVALAHLFADAVDHSPEDSAPDVWDSEQLFRGHLVHVPRLPVGGFLSADSVLVENLGGFLTATCTTRPLSHEAREDANADFHFSFASSSVQLAKNDSLSNMSTSRC